MNKRNKRTITEIVDKLSDNKELKVFCDNYTRISEAEDKLLFDMRGRKRRWDKLPTYVRSEIISLGLERSNYQDGIKYIIKSNLEYDSGDIINETMNEVIGIFSKKRYK